MLRLFPIISVCALLFTGACSSLRQSADRSSGIAFILSSEDLKISASAASYVSGLIAELEEGHNSSTAVEFFLRAAENDPSNYMLTHRAASSLLYKGRSTDAVSILENHAGRNPSNYTALLELAQVYQAQREIDKGLNILQIAMQSAPTNPVAYVVYAHTCLTSGRIDQALNALSDGAKRSDPAIMSDIALLNGASLVRGGLVHKAPPWFELSAKNSASNRSGILLMLAEIYDSMNKKSDAVHAYQRALGDKDAGAEAYVRFALYQSRTNLNRALKTLTEGVKRFPQNDTLLTSIVYLASLQNRLDAALDIFESVLRNVLKSPSEEFYLQLGGLYEQTGSIGKAEDTFKEGLVLYPASHSMLNYLAYMWAEKDINLQEAEKMAVRALEAEPDNGAYLDTLGWIYFKQNRLDKALSLLERALKALPEDPVITEHYGDVLEKLGRIEDATRYWKQSYTLNSTNTVLRNKLITNGIPVKQESNSNAR